MDEILLEVARRRDEARHELFVRIVDTNDQRAMLDRLIGEIAAWERRAVAAEQRGELEVAAAARESGRMAAEILAPFLVRIALYTAKIENLKLARRVLGDCSLEVMQAKEGAATGAEEHSDVQLPSALARFFLVLSMTDALLAEDPNGERDVQ